MRGIIDRYIVREIVGVFLMVLFVLTFVLLMGRILQLMDLMVNKGVLLSDILLLVAFLMPSFLLFTIPVSLLVAVITALGRLTADNEVTVMKAAGISLYRLSLPVFAVGAFSFVLCLFVGFYLVPAGNYATKLLLYETAKRKAGIGIKEKVFNDDFRGVIIYADRVPVKGDGLMGVFISDTRNPSEPSVIVARKASLAADPGGTAVILRLEDGSSHLVDRDLSGYRRMSFSVYDIKLDLTSALGKATTKAKVSTEMTAGELKRRMADRGLKEEERRELAIELQKKLAIPFSCLVFAVLAVPLGMRRHRSPRSGGFTLGLMTVLAYYLLRMGGEALAETGRIPVVAGVWAPNVLFAALAVYLFLRAAADKGLPLLRGGG